MKICGIQKLTLLDYPSKTACTVFTGGCNFRCPFCHNASLVVDTDFDEAMTNDEFFSFLRKRKGVLDGVCITGGEPLIHNDVEDFIREIKSLGYLVKLDTNGSFPDKLKRLVESGIVDYVAMDIKNSKENYFLASGTQDIDISKIEESVEFLKEKTVDYEFRTTAVKGIHTENDFNNIAMWISSDSKYFIQNYIDSGDTIDGRTHINPSFSGFSKEEIEHFREIVRHFVPLVEIRGI